MTLEQPSKPLLRNLSKPILCHECGAEVTFRKEQVGPKGKEIPLDPYFGNQPHQQHCMYARWNNFDSDTEPLLFDFLSKIPKPRRQKRIIGAVGRAKN
jgi:hypothetical protein